ncbi:MAG: serine hydrolase domain-containing protein, partial [Verrucomicrobiota bacterium]|nr:serine hydrolase domain-containing protein [Verrucomicrobiota bacterium]
MKNIIFQFIYIGILVTSTKCFAEDEISVRWKPLDELAKKAVSSAKIPGGSVCVVENGSVVFNQSYGVLNDKTAKLWESNTPVFIASITKPITATLVAVLVEQKKLSFDDPISKYIPEYSKLKLRDGGAVRSPTIAECLSHTSGFP